MKYKFSNERISLNDFFIKLNLITNNKLSFSVSEDVLKNINNEFEIICHIFRRRDT